MIENLRILKVTTDGKIADTDIPHTLGAMQSVVGGYIQAVYIGGEVYVVCDEEGAIKKRKVNTAASDICKRWGFYIRLLGDVFFVGNGVNDFKSLTDVQIQALTTKTEG